MTELQRLRCVNIQEEKSFWPEVTGRILAAMEWRSVKEEEVQESHSSRSPNDKDQSDRFKTFPESADGTAGEGRGQEGRGPPPSLNQLVHGCVSSCDRTLTQAGDDGISSISCILRAYSAGPRRGLGGGGMFVHLLSRSSPSGQIGALVKAADSRRIVSTPQTPRRKQSLCFFL